MTKKKVFISYDYDNDKALKEFILEQARKPDSPFEITDLSLKEAAPEADWLERARTAIARAEVFMIMLGPKTSKASGVLKELRVALEKEKRRFQIIGYTNGTRDWAVPDGGTVYNWDWENLKKLLG